MKEVNTYQEEGKRMEGFFMKTTKFNSKHNI